MMCRRLSLLAAVLLLVLMLGATWDAPRTPVRLVQFFEDGQMFFLDTFADGYQAVKLDAPTEQALRATRGDQDFSSRVYRVIRHGDDFVHFRSASEETDIILPVASIRRLSYRVEKQFDYTSKAASLRQLPGALVRRLCRRKVSKAVRHDKKAGTREIRRRRSGNGFCR